MVELVFVIVMLGILAAAAIPRLAVSRDDAILVKGKSQITAIRSGIAMLKSKRLLEGKTPFIPATLEKDSTTLFHGGNDGDILNYSLYPGSSDGEWSKTDAKPTKYNFHYQGKSVLFDYNSTTGSFDCDHTVTACQDLTK